MVVTNLEVFWSQFASVNNLGVSLTAHNSTGKNEKVHSLRVPALKFTGQLVGLKRSNYTFEITISVSMWNLEQFREKLIFCQ